MQLIDFDRQFARYLRAWMASHEDEYENPDQMEAEMPQVYADFLATPADWLAGRCPGDYFDQWDDPQPLLDWMEAYVDKRVSLPDMLLNRIAALGPAAEQPLMALLVATDSLEKKMLAITLLRELGSLLPMQLYVDWQQDRGLDDELCDNALESLEQMGEAARQMLLEGLEGASLNGKEALLSLLSRFPPEDRVLEELLRLLTLRPERRAVLAAYLGRLGDERALPMLCSEALAEDLKYLDYIELRSAIEALGGEAPEREFFDDPEYDALMGVTP